MTVCQSELNLPYPLPTNFRERFHNVWHMRGELRNDLLELVNNGAHNLKGAWTQVTEAVVRRPKRILAGGLVTAAGVLLPAPKNVNLNAADQNTEQYILAPQVDPVVIRITDTNIGTEAAPVMIQSYINEETGEEVDPAQIDEANALYFCEYTVTNEQTQPGARFYGYNVGSTVVNLRNASTSCAEDPALSITFAKSELNRKFFNPDGSYDWGKINTYVMSRMKNTLERFDATNAHFIPGESPRLTKSDASEGGSVVIFDYQCGAYNIGDLRINVDLFDPDNLDSLDYSIAAAIHELYHWMILTRGGNMEPHSDEMLADAMTMRFLQDNSDLLFKGHGSINNMLAADAENFLRLGKFNTEETAEYTSMFVAYVLMKEAGMNQQAIVDRLNTINPELCNTSDETVYDILAKVFPTFTSKGKVANIIGKLLQDPSFDIDPQLQQVLAPFREALPDHLEMMVMGNWGMQFQAGEFRVVELRNVDANNINLIKPQQGVVVSAIDPQSGRVLAVDGNTDLASFLDNAGKVFIVILNSNNSMAGFDFQTIDKSTLDKSVYLPAVSGTGVAAAAEVEHNDVNPAIQGHLNVLSAEAEMKRIVLNATKELRVLSVDEMKRMEQLEFIINLNLNQPEVFVIEQQAEQPTAVVVKNSPKGYYASNRAGSGVNSFRYGQGSIPDGIATRNPRLPRGIA